MEQSDYEGRNYLAIQHSSWHRDFVRQLSKIAPDNQYIIATHSEDVFASADKDHRFLLQNSTAPTYIEAKYQEKFGT